MSFERLLFAEPIFAKSIIVKRAIKEQGTLFLGTFQQVAGGYFFDLNFWGFAQDTKDHTRASIFTPKFDTFTRPFGVQSNFNILP